MNTPLTQEQREQAAALLPYAVAVARRFSRHEDSEGIATEALIDAVISWDNSRGTSLKTWVWHKVKGRVKNASRKASYERRKGITAKGGESLDFARPDAAPSILEALAALPPLLAATAHAKWIDRKPDREIKASLRLSWEEYYATLDTIRALLREHLQ